MRQLEIDQQTTLAHILGELKTTEEDGLELTAVPGETTILDNPIHKAVIEKAAANFKKEVVFPASPLELAPEIESDDLGFIEGEDILAKVPIEEVHQMIQPSSAAPLTKEVSPNKKRFKIPDFLRKKSTVIIGGIALVILTLGLIFYFLPSAEIDLVLTTDTKDSQVTIAGSTIYKEVSLKDKQIPMKVEAVTKDGTDQMTTTGKKTVGTVATGRVNITNLDTTAKNFVKGTILTPVATGSATFKTTEDLYLEAAPFGDKVEKAVQVAATKAGAESNMPANTTFKVGSESSPLVYGKNTIAFSGGSSKLATVASSEDRDALKKKLVDKLTADIKSDLEKKTKDSLVPDESSEVTVVKETYDPKEVDAETDSLKATIQIKVNTILVNKGDLLKILVDSLEKSASGFNVNQDSSKVSAQQLEKTSDTGVKLLGKIKAVLSPEVSQDEIRRKVSGKSLGEVNNYLDSNKDISSYKVVTSPSFFDFFNRMPFLQNRIKINVSTN